MILLRVIEHVKAQNWTAVALDFVIVVMGVFIGLQVQDWNTARVDHGRARQYLERINADLQADINHANANIAFWKKVSAFGEEGLAYAENGAAPGSSNWDVLLAYFQASQVSELVPTRTTYDEMSSAGDLGLIRNIELRQLISHYYTNAVQRAVLEYPRYREHVRGAIPTSIQSYIWSQCYNSNPERGQELIACDSPVEESRAGAIIKTIGADAELMSELRYWVSTLQVAALIAGNRIEETTRIGKMIDAELGAQKSEKTE